MDLDDFKMKYIPDATASVISGTERTDSIMDQIHDNLAKQKRQARYFAIVDITLALIYISLLKKEAFQYNLGLTLLCSGLILSSLYFYNKSRLISDSLYSLPIITFLEKAEKRLEFMRLFDWMTVIPLLALLGTGGGLVFVARLSNYTSNIELLIVIWVIFFIALILFGFAVSRKNWARDHGTLLDEVRRIRSSLSEDNK